MRVSPSNWLPPRFVWLSAVVSGLLLAAAFPPFSFAALSVIALVPLFVALHRGSHGPGVFFKSGYLFGFVYFGAQLWWIVRLSPASSITVPWLMAPATALLVCYLALYPALWMWLVGWIGRGRKLWIIFLAPSTWVIVEWVRSTGVFGFPWGSIGYSTVRHPSMMQSASLGGVLGLGVLLILVNALWSGALLARGSTVRALLLMAGFIVLVSNVVGGRIAIDRFDAREPDQRATVVLAQPNVDLAIKWEPEFTDSIFRLIERQSAALDPALIVFPETAAPIYMRHNLEYRALLRDLSETTGAGILIGYLDGRYDGPNRALNVYNAAGLFRPDGGMTQYEKTHLLPFGEMIPFGWRFRFLQRIDLGQANFQPGPRRPPIPSAAGDLAPLICFESAFPGAPREAVAAGADVLVNITNDGWFGQTPGPYQHADMAILRAVENRRFLIRSANTGVTMIVDPVGRITQKLPMDQEGLLRGEIHRVEAKTPYTLLGNLPVVAASLLAVLLGVVARLRASRVPSAGLK
jgi:apolipoprotein N-acyltransferase